MQNHSLDRTFEKEYMNNWEDDKSIKFLIASCTKHAAGETLLYKSFKALYNNWVPSSELKTLHNRITIDIDILEDNHRSITSAYNRLLSCHSGKYDYIMFIHDDVQLVDLNELLLEVYNSPFDMTGVAGSRRINLSVSPISWYSSSADIDRFGVIYHPCKDVGKWVTPPAYFGNIHNINIMKVFPLISHYGGGQIDTAQYSPNSPIYNIVGNDTYNKCVCIDGVFMAINKKIQKAGICFDERFDFHFYDLDYSLAFIRNNFTVGVTSRIKLIHISLGLGILRSEYLKNQDKFLDKYHDVKGKIISLY